MGEALGGGKGASPSRQRQHEETLPGNQHHWTGHGSRLDRENGKRFGDRAYAFEELVAEMGAAFLCASVGIPYATQHSDYIGDWIRVLKDDKRAILSAAAKAQAAMDFIFKTKLEKAAA